jgi:hypothetical protein
MVQSKLKMGVPHPTEIYNVQRFHYSWKEGSFSEDTDDASKGTPALVEVTGG